ncbi:hypothetical protein [Brucella anthropi]|uniref:hypothetical protein n=1 Tax=Brucella anthropi TaxID=529 RepID=UPI00235FEDE0|nr:hypothetical protein [Brucella anthropi]
MKPTGATTRNETGNKPKEGAESGQTAATASTAAPLDKDEEGNTNPPASGSTPPADEETNKVSLETTKASAGNQTIADPDVSVRFGPKARCEIHYGGKVYAPGERLPADLDMTIEVELDEIGAI